MSKELHTFSGAYAVHALPDSDGVLFEKHMKECPTCRAEVRRLRETAVLLALAIAEPPPAALRARVLAAVAQVRQEPAAQVRQEPADRVRPLPADDAPTVWRPRHPASSPAVWDATHPAESPSPWDTTLPDASRPPGDVTVWKAGPPPRDGATDRDVRRRSDEATVREGLPGSGGGRSQEGGGDPATIRGPFEGPVAPEIAAASEGVVVPMRRRRGRAVAGLAAVSTAAAIALGVVVFDARRDLGDLQARDGEVAAVLAAPDVTTVRQPITAGGSGTVVVSRARGRMVFTSSGLPELPRSRVYELWLMGRDGIRPAGLLNQRPDGVTTPILATAAKGDEHIGLTVEPAGGSEQPTTQPVLFAELPTA
ncbi:anti-sigma factor [Nonomuraea sp. NEAU-A123]|uniref:anti-sigma factor n=1 Tax=Nonomuraea sp. NEAU-A123 TaxID=2839649 RepID=UPI001BE483BF|nr:anti-sigma factor [Nonomuraea sp. NEAU-A123]MBT2232669.1 anti-sigma factor [Nonomuraea sp. NEAU-A123]